ncbi:hypothetical protein DMC30DRAFT_98111 [Rhodotorula diobovata]|uniref:Uncharacterized protein n=1 Tax=Rhodotorula diobovata TaxID=5288 RepID=A0A5C5FLF9_9BASI|nr:hypothetical protein DMC30DRAFT_98111 [Rhodotorula diobovata]
MPHGDKACSAADTTGAKALVKRVLEETESLRRRESGGFLAVLQDRLHLVKVEAKPAWLTRAYTCRLQGATDVTTLSAPTLLLQLVDEVAKRFKHWRDEQARMSMRFSRTGVKLAQERLNSALSTLYIFSLLLKNVGDGAALDIDWNPEAWNALLNAHLGGSRDAFSRHHQVVIALVAILAQGPSIKHDIVGEWAAWLVQQEGYGPPVSEVPASQVAARMRAFLNNKVMAMMVPDHASERLRPRSNSARRRADARSHRRRPTRSASRSLLAWPSFTRTRRGAAPSRDGSRACARAWW